MDELTISKMKVLREAGMSYAMIGNIVNISETSVKYYINPKYKECQKEYRQSEKEYQKEYQKEYRQSEKGKESEKKYRQKIAVKDKSPKLRLTPGG
jgi:predicted transcriptional regulator